MAAPLIPLFPLGTVLLPGAPLPLHIFEDRYRSLMRDLLDLPPGERRFGVIAIRQGREVGSDGVRALHDVGCMAQIVSSQSNPDGTYELEAVGTTRFRIVSLDSEQPYLRGTVEWLPEPAGDVADLVGVATQRYADYRTALGGIRNVTLELPELPTDPRLLSYLIAATVIAEVSDRQAFLAEYDAASRLAAESRWLFREATLVRELSAVPAVGMINVPSSVN
jgi:Lon protease-like protein